jgi:putative endonuclease
MRWPWKKRKLEPEHLRTGAWGEGHAVRCLRKAGYKILGRRVRIGRRDELDIVASRRDVLVFVEVKTRGAEDFGRPVEAVDRAKRQAMSRAAMGYLQRLKKKPPYFRFDVVEVVGAIGDKHPDVRHLENAFPLDRRFEVRW